MFFTFHFNSLRCFMLNAPPAGRLASGQSRCSRGQGVLPVTAVPVQVSSASVAIPCFGSAPGLPVAESVSPFGASVPTDRVSSQDALFQRSFRRLLRCCCCSDEVSADGQGAVRQSGANPNVPVAVLLSGGRVAGPNVPVAPGLRFSRRREHRLLIPSGGVAQRFPVSAFSGLEMVRV